MSIQLTQEEGEFLVELARSAVEEYLKTRKIIPIPEMTPKKLAAKSGAFVTINSVEKNQKKLRGCIGYPYPTEPLAKAVIQSAIGAATEDPRFNRLGLHELEEVMFETSVLTPPQRIEARTPKDYRLKIKIGKDGLIVERGLYRGLLLPQVPVEWRWDVDEFLSQCCMKAGLPFDSWLLKDTNIYKFQAIVFEEVSPKGTIKRKEIGK